MTSTYHALYLSEPRRTLLYNTSGEKEGEVELPVIFRVPVRRDLIRRAFLAEFTARLQPKGRDPMAGKRTSARSFGVNRGMARVPRLPTGRAAFINFAVGGMAAHPPRTDRILRERINRREKRLAVISALSATADPKLVKHRGHLFEAESLPVILSSDAEENVARTSDARELLRKLGLWSDVERARQGTRIRAGRGKMRGRRYKEPKSILFVLSDHRRPLGRAVRNLPGVDVASASIVSVIHLAPGGVPGRLTVLTQPALNILLERFKDVI